MYAEWSLVSFSCGGITDIKEAVCNLKQHFIHTLLRVVYCKPSSRREEIVLCYSNQYLVFRMEISNIDRLVMCINLRQFKRFSYF
jgi:hypothetical protein